MSYNPGIPVSGQTLGSSRPQVQGNFQTLDTTIATNHVAMNQANAGKHTFTEMVARTTENTNQIQTGTVTHFSKLLGGITEWYFQREGTGVASVPAIQMSKGTPSPLASGCTFLPGGLIIKWGTFVATTAGTLVTFSTVTPFTAPPFSVIVTGVLNSTTQGPNLHLQAFPTALSFLCQSTLGGGINSYYVAIGI